MIVSFLNLRRRTCCLWLAGALLAIMADRARLRKIGSLARFGKEVQGRYASHALTCHAHKVIFFVFGALHQKTKQLFIISLPATGVLKALRQLRTPRDNGTIAHAQKL
ncbi:MAG: hypothetical protein H7Z42_15065 [Roseiflexaceae bacterium]|nr:hypothetical protein [Roseiflexaceae bacterium]